MFHTYLKSFHSPFVFLGQSNLSRLLTADAKKGAFRRYDGATSPGAISPKEGRRQRPKSIHVDHFQFEE